MSETCEVCGRARGHDSILLPPNYPELCWRDATHWMRGYERQRAEVARLRAQAQRLADSEGAAVNSEMRARADALSEKQRADAAEAEVLRLTKERDEALADAAYSGGALVKEHALVARLTKEVQEAREHLIGAYRQGKKPIDHACEQRAPYSEILVPGFVCWWHVGEALALAPPPPSPEKLASGSAKSASREGGG